jgi:hypothetical protein
MSPVHSTLSPRAAHPPQILLRTIFSLPSQRLAVQLDVRAAKSLTTNPTMFRSKTTRPLLTLIPARPLLTLVCAQLSLCPVLTVYLVALLRTPVMYFCQITSLQTLISERVAAP